MRVTRLVNRFRHGLLLATLLCALLARAAVPAGWMPMASGQGVVLAPCSGMGAMTLPHAPPHVMPGMAMHDADPPAGHHPDPGGDHPCSGAGVSVALDVPFPALSVAMTIMPGAVPAPRYIARAGHGLAAPPPPPTGPPILA